MQCGRLLENRFRGPLPASSLAADRNAGVSSLLPSERPFLNVDTGVNLGGAEAGITR